MHIKQFLSALCVCLTLLAPAAHAAVIDFEDLNVGTLDEPNCIEGFDGFISGGFGFIGDFDQCAVVGAQLPGIPDSGSQFLLEGGNLAIFRLDGQAFSISSLDLSTSLYTDIIPNQVTLFGQQTNGEQVSVTLTIDDMFRTYDLENFKDLLVLVIGRQELSLPATGPGYYNLDNLVVELEDGEVTPPQPMPVPATLPLSALALAGLAFMRRRR